MLLRASLLALPCLLLVIPPTLAAEQDLSQARDALTKQDNDADTERALEEVFQAAEKNYSLLRRGDTSLNYNFDYTYYGDQRIDLLIQDRLDSEGNPTGSSSIVNADVTPSASHTFTNAFTLDYGIKNNLTVSARLPLIAKYDSDTDITSYGMGDVSGSLRWQPFEYVPGKVSQTYFANVSLKTGDSPYEVDLDRHLSTGSGYYSLSAGGSYSKVIDPVVLFRSEEHTSELQSRPHLVCRLLLEKKNNIAAVRGRQGETLHDVYRAELTLVVGPLVTDGQLAVAQPADVAVVAQDP